jgi:hypothetical protein
VEQLRLFHLGMSKAWQLLVRPQSGKEKTLEELKEKYKAHEQTEKILGMHETTPQPSKGNGKGKFNKSKSKDNKQGQAQGSGAAGQKRKVEQVDGCQFCKEKGNVWKNHGDDECFRNPKSPRYRPKANRDKPAEVKQERPGAKASGNRPSDAAAVSFEEGTKAVDDAYAYWQEADGEGPTPAP